MRFSEKFDGFVEFDVELSEIPMKDNFGKDITVNFKLFDGFDSNKTFFTDSNGLEMQERRIDYNPSF